MSSFSYFHTYIWCFINTFIIGAFDSVAVRRPLGTKTGLKHLLPSLRKTTKETQQLTLKKIYYAFLFFHYFNLSGLLSFPIFLFSHSLVTPTAIQICLSPPREVKRLIVQSQQCHSPTIPLQSPWKAHRGFIIPPYTTLRGFITSVYSTLNG